jgi:anti-sigma regulatory factor (Ser/Thr protein kinase)
MVSAAFTVETLTATRHTIVRVARDHGMAGEALDAFALAANEVIANAIMHGGGHGSMRLWCDGKRMHCEIDDEGPGMPAEQIAPHPDTPAPQPSAVRGRGLWLARRCCHLEVRTGPRGTTVALSAPVPARPNGRPGRSG